MKRIFYFFVFLYVMTISTSIHAESIFSATLYAGQHTPVGTITIDEAGGVLTATYAITEAGWCMTSTHLYIGTVAPARHAPGRFPYQHAGLDCATQDIYTITGMSGTIYVAAHADVSTGIAKTSIETDLQATYKLAPGSGTYFSNNTLDSTFAGTYRAWCVDAEHLIYGNVSYTANLYSSLSGFPAGTVDRPDNMDLVNYIINQDYLAQGMSAGDVQLAIWRVIDSMVNLPSPGAYTPSHVDFIVADALANGDGFKPGCGQVMAVLYAPIDGVSQVTIIEYPVPCQLSADQQETAWALGVGGIPFRQAWGMYFAVNLDDNTVIMSADQPDPDKESVPPPSIETETSQADNGQPNNQAQGNQGQGNSANNTNQGQNHSADNASSANQGQDGQVTICHVTETGQGLRYHELTVSINALNGHFNENGSPQNGHEHDIRGNCPE